LDRFFTWDTLRDAGAMLRRSIGFLSVENQMVPNKQPGGLL
jgi:hypothetical protein